MSKSVLVGMADIKIARNPDFLTTLGLGSCIGITLYDPIVKIGGMAHIMLPTRTNHIDTNVAKFADTGLEELLKQLAKAGALRSRLQAKIAGGAHMFSGTSAVATVGEKNASMTVSLLRQAHIPILAQDTGGSYGRTIKLFTENGALHINTIGHGEKTL